ncbi:helix-turn-helix domain-containing protein [Propioniciclava coleopterorum]|uniref:Helix-turn-helix domain-containing protein n=1 Tax=Propioniciclava coleopterorum TaxID=2714937 RepID=A0A6G7Y849_9ACTN|nr:helix-turn-helix domain-containing protein [Propioniciclava coleopterorum]QIK72889.1 helix-turn-helix domain-containing protein [Propioniciclava coleopterorum]
MSAAEADADAVLASPVRRAILAALDGLPSLAPAGQPTRSGGLTAADLGGRLGLHVTTVRFHLDRLAGAGLVTSRDERAGVGRPRKRWLVPTQTDAEPDGYRLLAAVLADAMASGDAPSAEEAGRRWAVEHAVDLVGADEVARAALTPGAWLGKVGVVVDVLDRWGYAPTVTVEDEGRSATVCLNHCPLLELARANPAIACGVHRGVIAGTLEALHEPRSRVELEAFVGPDLCIAHIARPDPLRAAPSTNAASPERL